MVEDLYKKGHQTIRKADTIPASQLPPLNEKFKGLPKDKQQLKALLVEDGQIATKHIEEVIVGRAAESQGVIEGPIFRPQSTGATPEIDFYTAGKKVEAVDVKSFRAVYDKPGQFESLVAIDKIQQGLAKNKTMLLNMAHLNADHLLLFMKEIVEQITPAERMSKIIIALSDKNIQGLASKGFVLETFGNLFEIVNIDSLRMRRAATVLAVVNKLQSKSELDTNASKTSDQTPKTSSTFSLTNNPPPGGGLPYFKQRSYNRNLSSYLNIKPTELNIPKLLSDADKARKEELGKAFANFNMSPSISLFENDMNEKLEKIVKFFSTNRSSWEIGIAIREERHPEIRKETIKRVWAYVNTTMWEKAWENSPEFRKLSDDAVDLMLDSLLDSLGNFGPKSIKARLNLPHLTFPGGWIAEDLKNFKPDILRCFFKPNGNIRTDADIARATFLTGEFIRSMAKDRQYYAQYLKTTKSYLKAAKSDKTLLLLCELMEKESQVEGEFFYRPYKPKQQSAWDSFKDTFGFGGLKLAESAMNSRLNNHMRQLLNPATSFSQARTMVKQHTGDDQLLLKKIFSDIYLKTYTKYGVLRKYAQDAHYRNLTPSELKEIRRNQHEIDLLNTALWIRAKVTSSVRNQFNIGNSASTTVLNIVDKIVDHVTKESSDPLEDILKDDKVSDKEVISSFFDEEGILKSISREKRLSIIANDVSVPTGSNVPNKFVNLFYQLGSRIEDVNIRHQILRYLVKHPDADAVLEYNYQKVGQAIFSTCVRLVDGLRYLMMLKNLDFIKKYSDSKQLSNHHSLVFLAAEFFDAFYKCDGQGHRALPKKYLILSCIDSLSTLMFANNHIQNAHKVDLKIKEMFDDFKLPLELYRSHQNTEYSPWLVNCLNDLKMDQLEQLITKYDKI